MMIMMTVVVMIMMIIMEIMIMKIVFYENLSQHQISLCFYLSRKCNQLFIGRGIDQIQSQMWDLPKSL